MQNVSIEQIKAGRAYLGWSQTDLAQRAGLSQTALARIECRTVKPKRASLDELIRVLNEAGIKFVSHGVEFVPRYCEYCGRGDEIGKENKQTTN